MTKQQKFWTRLRRWWSCVAKVLYRM